MWGQRTLPYEETRNKHRGRYDICKWLLIPQLCHTCQQGPCHPYFSLPAKYVFCPVLQLLGDFCIVQAYMELAIHTGSPSHKWGCCCNREIIRGDVDVNTISLSLLSGSVLPVVLLLDGSMCYRDVQPTSHIYTCYLQPTGSAAMLR